MKNKKSQGLPINIIIIAAIALVVLFVLLTVFTGTTKKTVENIGSCTTKGGICAVGDKCSGDYPIPLLVSSDCPNTKPKNLCCLRAGTDDKQKETPQTADKPKSVQVPIRAQP